MIAPRWTPGPWVLTEYEAARGKKTGYASVRSSRGHRVADTVPTPDARLIAAAPELYAAATLAAQNIHRSIASGNFVGDDEHEVLRVLSAALAKARGEGDA